MAKSGDTETRLQIAAAALKLFAKHGIRATTTAMIASEAGVTEATVLSHFEKAEQLIKAALHPDVVARLAPELLDVVSTLDALGYAPHTTKDSSEEHLARCLRMIAINRLECARQHRQLFMFVGRGLFFRPRLVPPFVERVRRGLFPKLANVFDRSGALDHLRPAERATFFRQTAFSFGGHIAWRVFIWPSSDLDDVDEIERMVRFLTRGAFSHK